MGHIVTSTATGTAIELACYDGDCENEGRMLLESVNKIDARAMIRAGIDQLSQGQIKKSLDILNKGRIDSFSMELLDGGELRVVYDRVGNNGFQRMIYTLDPNGKTIGLIQEAYNSLGELVHFHYKMT